MDCTAALSAKAVAAALAQATWTGRAQLTDGGVLLPLPSLEDQHLHEWQVQCLAQGGSLCRNVQVHTPCSKVLLARGAAVAVHTASTSAHHEFNSCDNAPGMQVTACMQDVRTPEQAPHVIAHSAPSNSSISEYCIAFARSPVRLPQHHAVRANAHFLCLMPLQRLLQALPALLHGLDVQAHARSHAATAT